MSFLPITLFIASSDANCSGTFCSTGLPNVGASGGELRILLQILFGILAAVAVLVITIGAMRYVTSEGNPESTKKARATILYSLVGLVICLSAEAIVSFAVNKV